jgi:hypothetical protein
MFSTSGPGVCSITASKFPISEVTWGTIGVLLIREMLFVCISVVYCSCSGFLEMFLQINDCLVIGVQSNAI